MRYVAIADRCTRRVVETDDCEFVLRPRWPRIHLVDILGRCAGTGATQHDASCNRRDDSPPQRVLIEGIGWARAPELLKRTIPGSGHRFLPRMRDLPAARTIGRAGERCRAVFEKKRQTLLRAATG